MLTTALLALALSLQPPAPQLPQATTLLDVGGKPHTPTSVSKGHKLSAVVFVTVDCPISNAYSPELNRLVATYSPRGVEFFLVHVDPDLIAPVAKTHAKEFGYRCTILLDPRHRLVKALGATKTPEAAVIGASGALLYRGRIDDRYPDLGKLRAPRVRDLRDALDAALAGKPVKVARTEPVGCLIPKLG